MEKVVKRTLGYGKPKENEDYTHVIYTKDEDQDNENNKRDMREQIKSLERDYKSKIEHYKQSAVDKIAEIQAEADERVAEAQNEASKQKKEAEKFENINRNLIRITKERANAKRELTPKKQHTGYVFLSIEDYIYNCECVVKDSKKTMMLKLPCFRVRLQSPYDIALEQKAVKDLIYDDVINKLGWKMGFSSTYDKGFVSYTENELRKIWNDGSKTFMFKLVYKANFQKGFWEVEFLARDMPIVPPDMTEKIQVRQKM